MRLIRAIHAFQIIGLLGLQGHLRSFMVIRRIRATKTMKMIRTLKVILFIGCWKILVHYELHQECSSHYRLTLAAASGV